MHLKWDFSHHSASSWYLTPSWTPTILFHSRYQKLILSWWTNCWQIFTCFTSHSLIQDWWRHSWRSQDWPTFSARTVYLQALPITWSASFCPWLGSTVSGWRKRPSRRPKERHPQHYFFRLHQTWQQRQLSAFSQYCLGGRRHWPSLGTHWQKRMRHPVAWKTWTWWLGTADQSDGQSWERLDSFDLQSAVHRRARLAYCYCCYSYADGDGASSVRIFGFGSCLLRQLPPMSAVFECWNGLFSSAQFWRRPKIAKHFIKLIRERIALLTELISLVTIRLKSILIYII